MCGVLPEEKMIFGFRLPENGSGNGWMRFDDGGESLESDDGEWWWFEGWFGSKVFEAFITKTLLLSVVNELGDVWNEWTQEEAAAIQEKKKFVETLPTPIAPIHGEVLMIYLEASTESISAALFERREEGQVPIYFISRVLQGAELNYPALEKLILALVHVARRLRRYFQAHTVAILTNSPIKQALTKPEKSGRVAKWAIKLGEHDIVFRARGDSNKETPKDFLIVAPAEDNRRKRMIDADRPRRAKNSTRNGNCKLGDLCRLSTIGKSNKGNLCIQATSHHRISTKNKGNPKKVETKEEESWMVLIHEYLLSSLILEDSKESRKIKIKAPQYKLIRGSLYKKSFYTPWLRCIAPPKTDDVIKEIHEGSCGFNMEPCSMVVRFTKQGYYWPSIYRDIARIIQDCEKCKEQSAVRKRAEIEAIVARNAWPFSH
ncbi:reverse transcriptase domain-containing protein [Tanacetum coccineum]